MRRDETTLSTTTTTARRGSIVAADIASLREVCGDELRELSGRTVLITGSGGFLGAYLVETIVSWNASQSNPCRLLLPVRSRERALRNLGHLADAGDLHWIDWSGLEPLTEIIHEPADFIVHAASPVDPAAYMHDPGATLVAVLELTRHVIQYAQAVRSSRLLYISSGAVYGPACDGVAETYLGGPPLGSPRSCYAEGKRCAELLCLTSGVPAVVARVFAVLGPYQDLRGSFAIPDLIRQAAWHRHIRLDSDGQARRTFCYASDLTASLLKILVQGAVGDAYNVGGPGPAISILQLAQLISERMDSVPIDVPAASASTGPPTWYVPDITKLSALYRPRVSIENGLDRVLAHWRERQPNLADWGLI